jgi:hypothetical protein
VGGQEVTSAMALVPPPTPPPWGEGGQRDSAGQVGPEVSRSAMPASPGLTQQEH